VIEGSENLVQEYLTMSEHYKGYRIPKSLIGFAVRYYYRYKLSLRDVRDIMLDRGLEVSHQTISDWIRDFGPLYAQAIRKTRCSSFQDKWHIDEVHVEIKSEVFWLWRLVDSEGKEIEVLFKREEMLSVLCLFSRKP
jgi:putative transposase